MTGPALGCGNRRGVGAPGGQALRGVHRRARVVRRGEGSSPLLLWERRARARSFLMARVPGPQAGPPSKERHWGRAQTPTLRGRREPLRRCCSRRREGTEGKYVGVSETNTDPSAKRQRQTESQAVAVDPGRVFRNKKSNLKREGGRIRAPGKNIC